jgi:hypothetical protein
MIRETVHKSFDNDPCVILVEKICGKESRLADPRANDTKTSEL